MEIKMDNPEVDGLLNEQVLEIKRVFKEIERHGEEEYDSTDEHGKKVKKKRELVYIRFEDLDLAMRKFGVEPNPAEIADIENKFKLESKRHIFLDDFVVIMAKKLTADLSSKELSRAFRLIDTDGSGSLDIDEFRNLLNSININLSKVEINNMVEKADPNGDGTIDEDEFIEIMTSKASDK